MKLTAAQRLGLEVLVRAGTAVDCGKTRSHHEPRPFVNTTVAHNLAGLGLAQIELDYGFRFRFRATDAGRELIADA